MNTLIIGNGEIGRALYNVLKRHYRVCIRDIKEVPVPFKVEVLHICFPYFSGFVKEVKKYQKQYNPQFTIIHSTIPVGTSKKCNAFHSPVRGIHPYLEKSLKTFVKYLAPRNFQLKKYFNKAGIKIKMVNDSRNTEAGKIWSTTGYGLNIVLEKEIYKFCKKHKLNFDIVYTDFSKTYNEGYRKMGMRRFQKYILKHQEGKIGGHCVIPNLSFLKNDIAKFIQRKNKTY